MENFAGFYGLDWFAMTMSLLFLYAVGNKNRYAFLIGVFGSLAWIFVNWKAQIMPGVILNIILVFLNIRGYLKWKK